MSKEAPKYDWKCAGCGTTYAQKTAREITYCGECDSDLFFLLQEGGWSLPIRMGARSGKGERRTMNRAIYVITVLVLLALLIAGLAFRFLGW